MGLFRRKKQDIDLDTGITVTSAEKEPTAFANALAKTFSTTSKQLVWIYTINGIAWIWCSYILAFTGHDQIAESLSSNVCSVVIGQIGFYLVTKTVENIFKYNNVIGPWRLGIKKGVDESDDCENFDFPGPIISDPISGFDSSCDCDIGDGGDAYG